MLEKNMKESIKRKVSDWLETITDKKVVSAIKKDLIITGGCFTSMILNEKVNDYDCYFKTKDTVLKVANYYAKIWNDTHTTLRNRVYVLDGENPSKELLDYYGVNTVEEFRNHSSGIIRKTSLNRVKMVIPSAGVVGEEENDDLNFNNIVSGLDEISSSKIEKEITDNGEKKYIPIFISSNAITLSDDIQIVIRFYGNPSEIHDTYDFVHTKAYYDYGKNLLEIPRDVYECVVNKTLIYTGSKYPVCSLFRLRKFLSKGWKVNAGQILKISLQVSELDLTNIDVLEDQLIGVDTAYFLQLVNDIKVLDPETKSIDSTYIISVIDKIF
ncbi:MAG: hypothetical protein ACOC33_01995 [bacterium]